MTDESTKRPDLQAALAQLKKTRAPRRTLEVLDQYLQSDERVIRLAVGTRAAQTGVAVLTDRRFLFVWQGMVRNTNESIPLDLVTGVAVSKGWGLASIKMQGAQAMEEIKNVEKTDADNFAAALQELLGRRSHAAMGHQTAAPAGEDDPFATIKKLKELLDIGAISPEEYESKKTELMGRM